jgi:DNA-binding LacI/PurR family transcriptional regulator
MTISLRDVAERAGVSSCTVSKVLNDVPARIPSITREHVRRVAAELGYQPNRLARALNRQRTDTVGLMISGLLNSFFVEVVEEAERALISAGYQVLLDAAPANSDGSYSGHGKLCGWPVDGVLMWATPELEVAEYLGPSARGLPVVYLGFPRNDGADSVSFDLADGGRQIGEHLFERGFRNAVYVSNGGRDPRHNAFLSICRTRGIAVETVAVTGFRETRPGGFAIGEQIAARPAASRPRVVVCHNDVVAVGVYNALRRAGLRVPQDVAVVGFDGIEEGQYLDAPLTTVMTPIPDLCAVAAELLVERMTAAIALANAGRAAVRSAVPGTGAPAPVVCGKQVVIPVRLQVGATT